MFFPPSKDDGSPPKPSDASAGGDAPPPAASSNLPPPVLAIDRGRSPSPSTGDVPKEAASSSASSSVPSRPPARFQRPMRGRGGPRGRAQPRVRVPRLQARPMPKVVNRRKLAIQQQQEKAKAARAAGGGSKALPGRPGLPQPKLVPRSTPSESAAEVSDKTSSEGNGAQAPVRDTAAQGNEKVTEPAAADRSEKPAAARGSLPPPKLMPRMPPPRMGASASPRNAAVAPKENGVPESSDEPKSDENAPLNGTSSLPPPSKTGPQSGSAPLPPAKPASMKSPPPAASSGGSSSNDKNPPSQSPSSQSLPPSKLPTPKNTVAANASEKPAESPKASLPPARNPMPGRMPRPGMPLQRPQASPRRPQPNGVRRPPMPAGGKGATPQNGVTPLPRNGAETGASATNPAPARFNPPMPKASPKSTVPPYKPVAAPMPGGSTASSPLPPTPSKGNSQAPTNSTVPLPSPVKRAPANSAPEEETTYGGQYAPQTPDVVKSDEKRREAYIANVDTPLRTTLPLFCMAWCDNGRIVLGGGGGSSTSGIPSGLIVGSVRDNTIYGYGHVDSHDTLVYSIAQCPAPQHRDELAITAEERVVLLTWQRDQTEDGKELPPVLRDLATFDADFEEKEPFVSCLKYSPNGDMIATGGDDGVLRVWRIERHSEPADPDSPSSAPRMSASVSICATLKSEFGGAIKDIDWHPDGDTLASVHEQRSECLVWSVTQRRLVQRLDKNVSGDKIVLWKSCRFVGDSTLLCLTNQVDPKVFCSLKAFYRSPTAASAAAAGGSGSGSANEWAMYKEKHLRSDAKGLRMRLNADGTGVGVSTNDRYLTVLRADTLDVFATLKTTHELPMSDFAFPPVPRDVPGESDQSPESSQSSSQVTSIPQEYNFSTLSVVTISPDKMAMLHELRPAKGGSRCGTFVFLMLALFLLFLVGTALFLFSASEPLIYAPCEWLERQQQSDTLPFEVTNTTLDMCFSTAHTFVESTSGVRSSLAPLTGSFADELPYYMGVAQTRLSQALTRESAEEVVAFVSTLGANFGHYCGILGWHVVDKLRYVNNELVPPEYRPLSDQYMPDY